jgi:hypothetical protein
VYLCASNFSLPLTLGLFVLLFSGPPYRNLLPSWPVCSTAYCCWASPPHASSVPPQRFALPPLAHVGTAPSVDAASASRRPPFLGLAVPLVFTSSDSPSLLGLTLAASVSASAPRFWIRFVTTLHLLTAGWIYLPRLNLRDAPGVSSSLIR